MINESYYLNGYFVNEFINDRSMGNLLELTKNILSGKLKKGWMWEEKYKNTFDLRPFAYNYDDLLLDLVFENNIPDILMNALGYHPLLAHIQVRHVLPGRSYMSWHRDVYKYGNNKRIGLMPAPLKLIIYPKIKSTSLKIKFIPGSHRRFFKHKLLDKLQIYFSPKGFINNSNSSYTLFDASILHHTVPEVSKIGSIRYIYIFTSEIHLNSFKESSDLHLQYRKRLNDYLENK